LPDLPETPRSTVRRKGNRASRDVAAIHAAIDQALVAHVGFAEEGQPFVIPVNCWRVGEQLCFHLARGSRLAAVMAAGSEISVALTLVDGLVLARSAMHHSLNYRSVVLFGRPVAVEAREEKAKLLMALIERLYPGRGAEVRPPADSELDITAVFTLPIAEGTLKTRSGPPVDRPDDMDRPVWAGVIPLRLSAGLPEPDGGTPPGAPLPAVALA
jgi:nitroimidazol reductase NimA-like FMN-containing flavoprotein (pyridoxamine 5'-phosphate oxidase superfamily)